MKPSDWQRMREIYELARQRGPDDRSAFLVEACGDDVALRADLESLIAYGDRLGEFLEPPSAAGGGKMFCPALPGASAGTRFGAYTIRRVLGVGGMGIVYEAQQDSPRRIVALKVIRPGIASPRMLRRFEHEAELLGRLQHPGIAQIFEAGAAETDVGLQPYFAMEIVRGEPITCYASHRKLGTRDRLELLAEVCDAVEHAHHRGIIHRDLKPGNILVVDASEVQRGTQTDGSTPAGSEPQVPSSALVKVLDFGVARTIDSDVQTITLQTDIGQLIGTVPYMSPEQVTGDPAAVDTRSDVYSLGVLCYELLAGRLPYDLAGKSIPEAVRIIRDDEPTPLSAVNRVFRGDLETVVLTALDKDPDRRYASVAALRDDIHHYLHDEPVAARRDSRLYVLRKTLRRYRTAVALAAVIILTLTGALGVAIGARDRAERERDRALAAETRKQLVTTFLNEMLRSANPFATQHATGAEAPEQARILYAGKSGEVATVVDVLGAAARRLDAEDLDPLVEAELRHALGSTLADLGQFREAVVELRKAVDLRTVNTGAESNDTIQSLERLTYATFLAGDMAATLALARPVYQSLRDRRGAVDASTRAFGMHVGRSLEVLKRSDEAIQLLRDLSADAAARVGPDDDRVVALRLELARLLSNHDQADEALKINRQSMSILVDRPDARHLYASAAAGVADALHDAGRYREAARAGHTAVSAYEAVYGQDHPLTAYQRVYLSRALGQADKLDEARTIGEQALESHRRFSGVEHEWTYRAERALARILARQGQDLERAEAMARHALAGYQRICGSDHIQTLFARDVLGVVLHHSGRLDDAEQVLRKNVSMGARWLQGWEYARHIRSLGRCLATRGKHDEAQQHLLTAWDRTKCAVGADSDAAKQVAGDLVDLYEAWHSAEPGRGYDALAAEWRRRIEPGKALGTGDD